MKLSLFATTTMGLESVLTRELKELGYENCKTLNGKVDVIWGWNFMIFIPLES